MTTEPKPIAGRPLTGRKVLLMMVAAFAVILAANLAMLFAATGIGNGSTFRTISQVFDREQAGPVLGWTSAIAAYGAFYIPKVFGEQIKATTPEDALFGFAAFYFVCILINWWFYLRKDAEFHNP